MTRVEYTLPDVAEGLQEAEILTWQVAPGDRVSEDQVLVEVETDKSVVEIPSPYEGTVVRLGGAEGDIVPVGALLVEFEVDAVVEDTEPTSDEVVAARHEATATGSAGDGTRDVADRPRPAPGRILASPSTRRRAVQLGVELAAVQGTGSDERVTLADIERAADGEPTPARQHPAAAAAPADAEPRDDSRIEPLRGIRRRISQTMTETLRIPAINEWRDIDATELMLVQRRLRDRLTPEGVRLKLLPLVLKATAAALREHPRFNAQIDLDREEITYHGRIDLGVATATPDGLQVPVVRDVDRRSLRELAVDIERLAAAARDRTLTPADTTEGTCTVSNFGSFGTIRGVPLIRPPEVAIVGVGRVHDAVVPVDGVPAVRPILPLVVSTDHRLNDGAHLAAFCDSLAGYLADPALLLVS